MKMIENIKNRLLFQKNKKKLPPLKLMLSTKVKKTRAMVIKKHVNNKLVSNFITMDLETININNTLVPYLISYYNGNSSNSHFIFPPEEFSNLSYLNEGELDQYVKSMVQDVMGEICIRKYRGYKIYFHNFAKFDGYFLIKHLAQLGFI
jgi:hypothetical protein